MNTSSRMKAGAVRVLALFLVAMSPPAGADQKQYDYTAVLQTPIEKPGTVMAGGIRWNCAAKSCITRGAWPSPGVGACAALAAQVGVVLAYGYPGRELSGADLAQCNRGVAAKPGNKVMPGPVIAKAQPLPPGPQQPAKPTPQTPGGNAKRQADAPAPNTKTQAEAPAPKKDDAPASKKDDAPAPKKEAEPAGGKSASPTAIAVRTDALRVTGTGPVAMVDSAGAPIPVRTTALNVTGAGPVTIVGSDTPIAVRTSPLTVTGTGPVTVR